MRLTWMSWQSKLQIAVSRECCRRFSCGSKSETVVPRARLPRLRVAPACSSNVSSSEVLPAPAGPTSAMLRMPEVVYPMALGSPRLVHYRRRASITGLAKAYSGKPPRGQPDTDVRGRGHGRARASRTCQVPRRRGRVTLPCADNKVNVAPETLPPAAGRRTARALFRRALAAVARPPAAGAGAVPAGGGARRLLARLHAHVASDAAGGELLRRAAPDPCVPQARHLPGDRRGARRIAGAGLAGHGGDRHRPEPAAGAAVARQRADLRHHQR